MKDDEIVKLKMLHDAYEKQKLRVVKLMEIDAKKIGIKKMAREIGVEWSYLYRTFDGGAISFAKIQELYLQIKDLKNMLGVYDDEE